MSALRLSYLNLPIKLRQCFAFCALFPKDEEINKNFLINLWVANGFVSSEDFGDQVWNELYWRSFFQDIETDEFGKIIDFKMHDLVHDLAQSIAEEVCHITDDKGVTSVSRRIRHLSIPEHMSFKEADSIQLHQVKSLKTCIFRSNDVEKLPSDVMRCYSLRVLRSEGLNRLSSSIGKLKHLRSLNLSYGRFKTLPKSMCKLLNLQILNLEFCPDLQNLPSRLKCLKALEHLCLKECYSLSSLPPQIGELTSLRTLSTYFVGRQRGFLLAELGRLNLKGELHIMHLERVKSVMDAKDAKMGSKQVKKLVLSWEINEESQVQENVEQILEVLQPHPQQLQTLKVEGYGGVHFPEWITGCVALETLELEKLPNLVGLSREAKENVFQHLSKLCISDCPKLLALPCLSSLKQLTIMEECSQDLLSSIHKSRSLERLDFSLNKELSCFPDGMLRDLTSLKTLGIYSYSKLKVLPLEQGLHSLNFPACFQHLTSLENLDIVDCPEVEDFPEALQHMTSLQSLKLYHLRNLRSLPHWLGNLALLHSLCIVDCPKLMCLPMSIQCLSSLKSLTIRGCPELEKRCKEEIGEDWPKIAHIPDIDLLSYPGYSRHVVNDKGCISLTSMLPCELSCSVY